MGKGPLHGLKVIDVSTIVAGPTAATILGEYGAEVIKIEHPEKGDALRNMGLKKDGVSLWWKLLSRNKKSITLKLSTPEGKEVFEKLVEQADILIENFRPGTLEKWGLGFEQLQKINKGLVVLRVTGFGQTGPYSQNPGFGTVAEAMSGFAHITGYPDGPPTLPPFALGDGVAGLFGASAVMFAIWWRDAGEGNGEGQVIDISLYEPLMYILGSQILEYDQLNVVQTRSGNRPAHNKAPRNAFQTSDGRWVALSANSPSIVERIINLLSLSDDPRFVTFQDALEHGDELDELLKEWISNHSLDEVLDTFTKYQAAIGPVYSVADIVKDPHFISRDDIVEIDDPQLGKLKMQGLVPRFSKTPGRIDFAGPEKGEYNNEIYKELLGLSEERLNELKEKGTI